MIKLLIMLLLGKMSYAQNVIEMKKPFNHSMIVETNELVIEYDIHVKVSDGHFLKLESEKLNGLVNDLKEKENRLTISSIDPGSHFIKMQLYDEKGIVGNAVYLHFERILSVKEIKRHQAFPNERQFKNALLGEYGKRDRKTKVVLITATGRFDGQKRIWLQILKQLPAFNYEVEVITFQDIVEGKYTWLMRDMGIELHCVPLSIDGQTSRLFQVETSKEAAYFMLRYKPRLEMDRVVYEENTPGWVKKAWNVQILAFQKLKPDILVFGNSRNIEDQTLVISGRMAKVPKIVMELPNLGPYRLKVDAVIGPSLYAIDHISVLTNVNCTDSYIVHPGVDTELFRPRDGVHFVSNQRKPIKVGYVGRMATEKSLAVFIYAAAKVLRMFPDTQFLLVGQGKLLGHLQALADHLNISRSIQFYGTVEDDKHLAKMFQQMDIFASPSLSAWSETFCIANIEAMASGLPIVTFGVGGIGQYAQHGYNAIVVNESMPQDFANGIMTLLENPTLRMKLSQQARKFAVDYFSLAKLGSIYHRVYQNILARPTII